MAVTTTSAVSPSVEPDAEHGRGRRVVAVARQAGGDLARIRAVPTVPLVFSVSVTPTLADTPPSVTLVVPGW